MLSAVSWWWRAQRPGAFRLQGLPLVGRDLEPRPVSERLERRGQGRAGGLDGFGYHIPPERHSAEHHPARRYCRYRWRTVPAGHRHNPNLDSGERIRERYFDPAAFEQPARGKFGNAARNAVVGGGLNTWGLSVFKGLPLGRETGRLEFRAEFYNAFNHTQWNAYRTGFGSTGFGSATGVRDARPIQFGLRFYW